MRANTLEAVALPRCVLSAVSWISIRQHTLDKPMPNPISAEPTPASAGELCGVNITKHIAPTGRNRLPVSNTLRRPTRWNVRAAIVAPAGQPSSMRLRAKPAITGETEEALDVARELAEKLGVRPFELADGDRTLYHAGAVFASNYLVTVQRAAVRLGVPAEGLVPLMTRTIENGFELTGPIARGDWATVEAHERAIRAEHPELENLYETLAEATVLLA